MRLQRVISFTPKTAVQLECEMQLDIHHVTTYHYTPAVSTAQHLAHLLPRATPVQNVIHAQVNVKPLPHPIVAQKDHWGNTSHYFALHAPHEFLEITGHSQVQTQSFHLNDETPTQKSWEHVRDALTYAQDRIWDRAQEFTFASPYVQPHADFADYATPSFSSGRTLVHAAIELMERIHRDFTYASASTTIHTPARQALQQRKGVCQDFAHILLSCLRTQGLAARYVSGYLLTAPPPGQAKLIGSDASHAWVSVYIDNDLWLDLDPTNNRSGWFSPGCDYATLAWGRDFGDVSPLRGVIYGGANHSLKVAVTVTEI
jgi:transglutaminase-like putative cysteine protease